MRCRCRGSPSPSLPAECPLPKEDRPSAAVPLTGKIDPQQTSGQALKLHVSNVQLSGLGGAIQIFDYPVGECKQRQRHSDPCAMNDMNSVTLSVNSHQCQITIAVATSRWVESGDLEHVIPGTGLGGED